MRTPFLLVFSLLLLAGCSTMKQPVRVGMLVDEGATDPKSREAAWNVVAATPDFVARRVTGEEVRAGVLAELDVFILPGGTGSGEARALGIDGARAVKQFVGGGNGLIAICAGGYAIVEGWTPETKELELLNGQTWDDAHWARGMDFITVEMADGQAARHTMWFENGPLFVPWERPDLPAYTPLVRYVTDMAAEGAPTGMMTGRDAVVAAPYGDGRLVAFGPHPELSPGLEHWLRNAVRWAAHGNAAEPITAAVVLEGR
ncbi:MAG: hypothetical protein PWP23_2648 [Candidatus Sumerlaeota bacterium]|nr:hypothetical protein [Candidatus Sumerlaeota bacterium]